MPKRKNVTGDEMIDALAKENGVNLDDTEVTEEKTEAHGAAPAISVGAPIQAQETPTAEPGEIPNFTVMKAVKLFFTEKPSPAVRKLLKDAKFRWDPGTAAGTESFWWGDADKLPFDTE